MIVAIFNPKGGAGKTTTAVNVGAALARSGRSVLVVDLEADMNASISLGVRPADAEPSVYRALLHEARPTDVVRPVRGLTHLHLVTGSAALADVDRALQHARHPERRLADVVRPLATTYDMVLLDCPSGFSTLPVSVPEMADHLVVPIRADYLSLESLAHFFRWYRDRRKGRTQLAPIAGVLLTMVDERRQATREVVDIIRAHNRNGVFRTQIPFDPRVAEIPSHGVPLVGASRSKAATAYERFTQELLSRLRRRAR